MIGYLRHLANYAYVVQSGSMTGAAQRLGCAPSALSDSVKILEAYYQEPLLERSKKGVSPTGKGLAIYKDAQNVVEAMESALHAQSDAIEGPVRLSAPTEVVCGALAPAFAALRQSAPDVHLIIDSENKVLDHTRYARDLYVRVGTSRLHADLHKLHDLRDHVVLVARSDMLRPGNIGDGDAIARLNFIAGLNADPETARRITRGEETLTFRSATQVGTIEARIALMRQGLGALRCLRSTVAQDIAKGDVIELLPNLFTFPISGTISTPHRKQARTLTFVAAALAKQYATAVDPV